jgi:hypothetical protein
MTRFIHRRSGGHAPGRRPSPAGGVAGPRLRRRVATAVDSHARLEPLAARMTGPPFVASRVRAAVLPVLMPVRPLLVDPDGELPREPVEQLWRYLTDGLASPLFDDSPEEARQHARGIAQRLVDGFSLRVA